MNNLHIVSTFTYIDFSVIFITSIFFEDLAVFVYQYQDNQMNYSTENEDYLMTTPYTKKIQQKFKEVKSFLEKNGFNPNSESLMQDIISAEEYITKNGL